MVFAASVQQLATKIGKARSMRNGSMCFKRGDLVALATPGGGGHGPAQERDAAAPATDLAERYVSEPAAYRKGR